LGPKIAEGGQAEIFEVEVCSRRLGLADVRGHVVKVFKKGYSLQDLKFLWPDDLLFGGQFLALFQGSLVLEDDRFALLLSRSDMDLRKLIDVTLDEYSPLFDHKGSLRLEELRAYINRNVRALNALHHSSVRSVRAERIMCRIAMEMRYLHSVDILHRDLNASNILCSTRARGRIGICVADYESSIGVVGTAFWRAPEILKQLKERKPEIHFTGEADVYGFAITCYEIWTGHIPFEEYKSNDYDHVLNGARPALPAHVPSWVKDLIQRCWHQNPSERPSFSAIIEELESRPMDEELQLVGSGLHSFVPLLRSVVVLERASEV